MSWEGFALAYADINQANNSLSYKGKVYYSQKAGNHPVFKAFHSYRYVGGEGGWPAWRYHAQVRGVSAV